MWICRGKRRHTVSSGLLPTGLNRILLNFSALLQELGEIAVDPVTSRYCQGIQDLVCASGSIPLSWKRALVRSSDPICCQEVRRMAILGHWPSVRRRGRLELGTSTLAGQKRLAERTCIVVVGNDRFLIVPTVRVENLASHVLSLGAFTVAGRLGATLPYSPCTGGNICRSEPFCGHLLQGGQLESCRRNRRASGRDSQESFCVSSLSASGERFFARNRRFDWARYRDRKRRRIGPRRNSARSVCMTIG